MSQDTQPPHLSGIREKDRLMALLASSRHKTLAALRDYDDFAMIYSDSQWRLKDILSHIAVWEREALAALQAFHEKDSAYQVEPDLDIEEYNQRTVSERKPFYPAQVRMDWAMVRRELQFAVSQISAERMSEPFAIPWHEEGTVSQLIEKLVEHEAEHLADVLVI
jgi:hypothetical protein